MGQGPYGLNFKPTHQAAALQDAHRDLPKGQERGEEVWIAGRVMSRRVMGKLAFFTLADETGTIQLFIEKAVLEINDLGSDVNFNFGNLDSEIFIQTEKPSN